MDVKELMICDLVSYNGYICRVYSVSSPYPDKTERYNNKPTITLCLDGFVTALEDEIEPIPLTEEILKANGFDVVEKACRYAVIKKRTDNAVITVLLIGNSFVLNIETSIEFDGTYATDNVHKCGYYVHELQHAMRLCGLRELADNFKLN